MSRYRQHLPQLNGKIFLTDGGIETTLIFHEGLDLPSFAAFHLLQDAQGTEALRRYFAQHAAIARQHGCADRGYRTVFNCNAEAGQSVFHIHVHVLGGRAMNWPPG